MSPKGATLGAAAVRVLLTTPAREKALTSRAVAKAWRNGHLAPVFMTVPPDRPARPERPQLLPPRDMPRRRSGGTAGNRVALLHALAHIELNAIDLTWDLIARFGDQDLPRAFLDDWVAVADDEARHFLMLADRLETLSSGYGALPAHDGLWQAAEETAHDLCARLAVVPLVLEARGLDVTPAMITRLTRFDDHESAEILEIILRDEITHVAAGKRWLEYVCARAGKDTSLTYQCLVRKYFRGTLKEPFNIAARDAAAFPADFYLPLTIPAQT